jgi:hypothetical protein
MLQRLFKPKWKHPNPLKRVKAVHSLSATDAEEHRVLAKIATGDDDTRVRGAATSKLLDLKLLARIRRQDPAEAVGREAKQRYYALIAGTSEDSTAEIITRRYRIVDESTDNELLAHVVRYSPDADLQFVAFRKITDAELIAEIAKSAPEGRIREAALSSSLASKQGAKPTRPGKAGTEPPEQPRPEPVAARPPATGETPKFTLKAGSLGLDKESSDALQALLDSKKAQQPAASGNGARDSQQLADSTLQLNEQLAGMKRAINDSFLQEAHNTGQEVDALIAKLGLDESANQAQEAARLRARLTELLEKEARSLCEHMEALADNPSQEEAPRQYAALLQSWRELPLLLDSYNSRLEKARQRFEDNSGGTECAAS